jgi:hypothetical protein
MRLWYAWLGFVLVAKIAPSYLLKVCSDPNYDLREQVVC